MNYFENNNGRIAKIWTTYPGASTWKFKLVIYDGNYVDGKFAQVQIYGGKLQAIQSNGYNTFSKYLLECSTYQQDGLTLTFEYGESNKTKFSKGKIFT